MMTDSGFPTSAHLVQVANNCKCASGNNQRIVMRQQVQIRASKCSLGAALVQLCHVRCVDRCLIFERSDLQQVQLVQLFRKS